jgi:hypothetical protein
MRWFQSNVGLGSRLALFALAIQFVLTFGHVHIYGFSPLAAKSAAAVADLSVLPSARDPFGKSDRSADPGCAICALIQLTASSAPSITPTLPLPAKPGHVALETPAELALAASPHFLFQARAPPAI